eukprot:1158031-Pelagomonas_calceolata.AAC.2
MKRGSNAESMIVKPERNCVWYRLWLYTGVDHTWPYSRWDWLTVRLPNYQLMGAVANAVAALLGSICRCCGPAAGLADCLQLPIPTPG